MTTGATASATATATTSSTNMTSYTISTNLSSLLLLPIPLLLLQSLLAMTQERRAAMTMLA
jgi:hypothetical protein